MTFNSSHETCEINPEGDVLVARFQAPTGLLFGGVGMCIVTVILHYILWVVCCKNSFFEQSSVALIASFVYNIALGIILFVCGLGVAIAWAVINSQNCLVEQSDDNN